MVLSFSALSAASRASHLSTSASVGSKSKGVGLVHRIDQRATSIELSWDSLDLVRKGWEPRGTIALWFRKHDRIKISRIGFLSMDSEPRIIGYGRGLMHNYPEADLKAALVRAFRDRGADYIVLDSNPRGQRFVAASAAWGIDAGLLYHHHSSDDGQQVVSAFRLTEKGTKEIKGR